MIDFLKYFSECEKMRKKFLQENNSVSREKLIKEFVIYLEEQGLSVEEIEKILYFENLLEAQGNTQMIANNKEYKEAVAKALGRK
ncbi:hypothetical protein FDA48_01515 [Clostridium botulinum]|nr:hypothetical protein [Clostridium botulinum]